MKSAVNWDVNYHVKSPVQLRWNDEESVTLVRGFALTDASLVAMPPFRVLEAARAVAAEVNDLLDDRKLRMIHRPQLRDSAQSIPANIREGMGRTPGPHRNQSYRDARGSAEETDEHLIANFDSGRLPVAAYWRIHNRIAWIVEILTSIIGDR